MASRPAEGALGLNYVRITNTVLLPVSRMRAREKKSASHGGLLAFRSTSIAMKEASGIANVVSRQLAAKKKTSFYILAVR